MFVFTIRNLHAITIILQLFVLVLENGILEWGENDVFLTSPKMLEISVVIWRKEFERVDVMKQVICKTLGFSETDSMWNCIFNAVWGVFTDRTP